MISAAPIANSSFFIINLPPQNDLGLPLIEPLRMRDVLEERTGDLVINDLPIEDRAFDVASIIQGIPVANDDFGVLARLGRSDPLRNPQHIGQHDGYRPEGGLLFQPASGP